MSLDLSRQLSVRIVNSELKSGSGFLYKRSGFVYVLTAKHCICPKKITECKSKNRECNNCSLEKTYKVKKTKIKIDNPGSSHSYSINPSDIISLKDKDLAVIVIKNKDIDLFSDLPEIEIADYRYLTESVNYYAHGYPKVTNCRESIPIIFDLCCRVREELYLKISSNTIANLESAKYNMDAASGMGVLSSETSALVGIYVKTDDFGGSYSEYIDGSVNDILLESGYSPLELSNSYENIKTLINEEYLSCFDKIEHEFSLGDRRNLEVYTTKISGKEIKYGDLIIRLYECLPYFCVPRKVIYDLKKSKMERKLVKFADDNFIKLKSDSKISDLMLQGFLEAEHGMPKLFSSMVGKEETKGIHVNMNEKDRYELVHSVSHFNNDIDNAFKEVIEKLYECICETESPDELISSPIFDSTFNDEEKEFLVSILIPSESENKKNVVDSYAILIGFDVCFSSIDRLLGHGVYKNKVIESILKTIEENIDNLAKHIGKVSSVDANIKLFFIPFDNVENFKEEVIKGLE